MLSTTPDGVSLRVHVQPGARRNAVAGVFGDALKLRVTARAVDGQANAAVIEFVAELFDAKARDVTMRTGQTSRRKRLLIRGISVDDADAVLDRLLHR